MDNIALTFSTIYENMKCKILMSNIGSEFHEIERVKLWDIHQKLIESDVVYIGTVKEFTANIVDINSKDINSKDINSKDINSNDINSIDINGININIILCTDNNKELVTDFSPNSNIIVVESNNIAKILSDVQDVIYNFHRILPINQELMKTLLENDNLSVVVNKCYKILDNPIAVLDSSFKLIAWTKDVEVNDTYWKEIVENGYPSINTIISMQKATGYKDLSQPMIIEPMHSSNLRKILTKIQDGKNTLGYIGVLEVNKNFNESEHELLKLITKILAKILLYTNIEKNKCDNDRYDRIIIDILEKKLTIEKQIHERLSYLKWNYYDKYYILTINMEDKDDFDTLSCFIRSSIKKLYPSCNVLIYHHHILMIDGLNNTMLKPDVKYLKPLKDLLIKSGLHCGISNCFSNLSELPMYYKQSLLAMELGEIVGNYDLGIYYYSDYALMYMI